MTKVFDLTGQIFGSLTVLGRTPQQVSRSEWNCRCICGQTVLVQTGNLRQKRGTKCACSMRRKMRARVTTHGHTRSPEYRTWSDMWSRCANPAVDCFARYGGRGIYVDRRWKTFEPFLADMGRKPSKFHSIERKDNDGPYSKENCYWASRSEQANNKSNNHWLEYNGKRQTIAQWAQEIGLTEDCIERRLNLLGWDTAKTLSTPHRGWGPGKSRRLQPS